MVYIRSVLEFVLGTKVDHHIFTESSSARQLVMKRGVRKVRHLDGKSLWIQNRKDFIMLQVPTDSDMADINTKQLGGFERRAYEVKKNFASKANKIAKMIVRIVFLEGLQPMVTEANVFPREIEQCRSGVEDSNRN